MEIILNILVQQTTLTLEIIQNWNLKLNTLLFLVLIYSGSIYSQTRPGYVTAEEVNIEKMFIEAKLLFLMDDIDDAEQAFLKLAEGNPTEGVYHFELSKLYKKINLADKSLDQAKIAVQKSGDNEWFLQHLASLAERQKQHGLAAETYQQLLNLFPDRTAYFKNLAFQQLLNNEPKMALSTLNKLEKKIGTTAEIIKQQHRIYDQTGDIEKAGAMLDKFLKKNPKDIAVLRMAAAFRMKEGQEQTAATYYNRILEINKNDRPTLLALAKIEKNTKQNTDQKIGLDDKIYADASIGLDAKIKLLIPDIFKLQDNPSEEKANNILQTVSVLEKIHGEDEKLFAIKGDVFSISQKYTKANNAYEKSMQLNDAYFNVWEMLMMNYLKISNYSKYDSKVEAQYDLFPNQAMSYFFYAEHLIRKNKGAEAKPVLAQGKIVAAKNKHHIALFECLTALNSSDVKQALNALEMTLKSNPASPFINAKYARLLAENSKVELGIDVLNNALKLPLNNNDVELLWAMADVQFQAGNLAEAVKYYEMTLKIIPNNSAIKKKITDLKSRL